jgi:hypothetical protein
MLARLAPLLLFALVLVTAANLVLSATLVYRLAGGCR